MKIDSVDFSIHVIFSNGHPLVLRSLDIVEFDYAGSHYKGVVSSIKENVKRVSDISCKDFILYVYGTMGNDQKQRLYDVPMWEIENLKLWGLEN